MLVKKMKLKMTIIIFHWLERPPTQIVFPTNFIFSAKRDNFTKFYKLIIGKSQVFSARSYVYFHGYRQIRDKGGTMCPPLGFNRVNG